MELEITAYILKRIFSKLPSWLIQYFYGSNKIAPSIDIELRNNMPIIFSFGAEIPSVDLYFQICNKSSFDLVLDRLLIDFWIGQPTFKGALLKRYDLPHGKRIENVYFGHLLTLPQQEQIKNRREGQLLSIPVTITLTGYFESKLGVVCVEKQINCTDVPCK